MAKSKYSKLDIRPSLERYEQWCRENLEVFQRIAEEVRLLYVCKKNSKRGRIERGKTAGGTFAESASWGAPSRPQAAVKVDKGGCA